MLTTREAKMDLKRRPGEKPLICRRRLRSGKAVWGAAGRHEAAVGLCLDTRQQSPFGQPDNATGKRKPCIIEREEQSNTGGL